MYLIFSDDKHSVPALIRRCDDLPATITHVPVAAVLVLNTPDDGRFNHIICNTTQYIYALKNSHYAILNTLR